MRPALLIALIGPAAALAVGCGAPPVVVTPVFVFQRENPTVAYSANHPFARELIAAIESATPYDRTWETPAMHAAGRDFVVDRRPAFHGYWRGDVVYRWDRRNHLIIAGVNPRLGELAKALELALRVGSRNGASEYDTFDRTIDDFFAADPGAGPNGFAERKTWSPPLVALRSDGRPPPLPPLPPVASPATWPVRISGTITFREDSLEPAELRKSDPDWRKTLALGDRGELPYAVVNAEPYDREPGPAVRERTVRLPEDVHPSIPTVIAGHGPVRFRMSRPGPKSLWYLTDFTPKTLVGPVPEAGWAYTFGSNENTMLLGDDADPAFRATLVVLPDRSYAISDLAGNYSFTAFLPPGENHIRIYHQFFGSAYGSIKVPALGGDVTLNFKFPSTVRGLAPTRPPRK